MALTRFTGIVNALSFFYGDPAGVPPPLIVDIGASATGSATLALVSGRSMTVDGVVFSPLSTNAPISIGAGANAETVTPSAVNAGIANQVDSATVTATFANIHGIGDQITSGTCGLQEALNYVSTFGGGVVVIDALWPTRGGTQAMINAATIPAGVAIQDNRSGAAAPVQNLTVTLTNAQLLALFTTPIQLLPAPGAGNMWDILDMTLENKFLTAAFAAGGAIQASYGAGVTTPATATVAATFLTSPAASSVIKVAGALAQALSTAVLNTAVNITNATANFTTGAGSVVVKLTYRMVTGL